ncbi:MAG: hypothetical protein AAGI92_09065 [Pseudomonadota bacterium]
MIIAKGNFTPGDNHTMVGGFTITQNGSDLNFATTEDFAFDGSPKPGFALLKGDPVLAPLQVLEAAANRTDFLRLKETPRGQPRVPSEGVFTAVLQSSVNLDDYDHVYLWCFGIPFLLGHAPIERL